MDFEAPGDLRATDGDDGSSNVADVLHAACGIYTRASVVDEILDAVEWRSSANLLDKRLLEPACGDGAFVLAATARLLEALAAGGHALDRDLLWNSILAYEIHPAEAKKARASVARKLIGHGLPRLDAEALADNWVKTEDFLLSPLEQGGFSHVVGNPPYLRWSKLPSTIRARYEHHLPRTAAKGDLFLPFLDRGIEALKVGGKLGFLCTDRWKYMAFADGFRKCRLPEVDILRDRAIPPSKAYDTLASTYPSVIVMQRRSARLTSPTRGRKGITLNEAGFDVRVGPALGCTDAFVLPIDHADEVEAELLRPWLSPSDVRDGTIRDASRVVICMHDDQGKLRDIERFPKAKAWLSRYRHKLEQRSIVKKQGAVWYRPIDKATAEAWKGPKLLVPELSKTPRLALDMSGAVPAHGLYSIQAGDADMELAELAAKLGNGYFAREMSKLAPKASGGYVRCYKRFIERLLIK